MPVYIVPLDGSSAAEKAIALAHPLAEATGATLELVHVLGAGVFAPDGEPSRLLAIEYLNGIAHELGESVPVRLRVLEGDPATMLRELTAHRPDAMVVMTTRGRSGVGRLMFGSVAERVIHGSAAPVLVMRESVVLSQPVLERILVPVDGTDLSEAALPMAIRLAKATGATLGLVRVVEFESVSRTAHLAAEMLGPEDMDLVAELTEQERDQARSYLDGLTRQVRQQGVRAVWEVRVGRAGDEIVRAAETTGASLVVMSTHGRSGVKRWAFGSVTDQVLRSGVAPVLVLPPMVAQPVAAPAEQTGNGFSTRRVPGVASD